MKNKIILASKSPRRADLLKQIGVDFTVLPSNFKEMEKSKAAKKDVAELVVKNALGKAKDVARKLTNATVLGVDTLIWTNGKIFGKPKDKKHAFLMLTELSTKPHFVFTGIVLIKKKNKKETIVTDFDVVKLHPRRASAKFIKDYIATGVSFDKAGGYTIEGKGALFFSRIEGDSTTVLGLPIASLLKLADKLNIQLV